MLLSLLNRILPKRLWFHMRTADGGDIIKGKVVTNRALELLVESGWSQFMLRLSEQEALKLRDWLHLAYPARGTNSNDSKLPEPLPIFRASRDSSRVSSSPGEALE